MEEENNTQTVIIGYYPFRAKGQIARLLCEYFHLNYRDRFFNPDQWNTFKEKEAAKWVIRDLPYLQDGDFVVTGPIGVVTYIAEKAGRDDIFGRNVDDKAKIDGIRTRCDLRTAMIGMTCVSRPNCELENKKCMTYYWEKKIKPILNIYEQECQLSPWFYSYITIMDFVIYQVINQLEKIFPQEILKLNKLRVLRDRVGKIPEIQSYQKSQRAVREYCPMNFFSKFKEQKLRNSRASSSASSTSSRGSRHEMDLQ